jgi:hypothetical protein
MTTNSLDEIAAQIRATLGVTDDDVQYRRRCNISNAQERGQTCAECARQLDPREPVWRERVASARDFFGRQTYWLAPVCEQCKPVFDRHWYGDDRHHEAEPCGGCGRPVHNLFSTQWRKLTFCCEDCHHIASLKAVRGKRSKARGHRTCECCGKTFVPKRADARFCSGACKQRAYRQRSLRIMHGAHCVASKSRNAKAAGEVQ